MSLKLTKSQYKKIIGENNKNESPTRRKNKYRNKHVAFNGTNYDSIAEYERHLVLMDQEKSGFISNLRYHLKSDNITLQDTPSIVYEPDFCYTQDGVDVVEDVKGAQTKDFVLKKKMLIKKIMTGEQNIRYIITRKKTKKKFITIEEYKPVDF